jgi:hypothetical protein
VATVKLDYHPILCGGLEEVELYVYVPSAVLLQLDYHTQNVFIQDVVQSKNIMYFSTSNQFFL